MSENPYQAPKSSDRAEGILSGSREDLRSVAKYQKIVVTCILVYFVAIVLQFVVPAAISFVVPLAVLGVAITGAVFVFKLAIQIYGMGPGIALGVLTLIPVIGLVVLVIVNVNATKILKRNGVTVGLMGADLSKV